MSSTLPSVQGDAATSADVSAPAYTLQDIMPVKEALHQEEPPVPGWLLKPYMPPSTPGAPP